MYYAASYYEPPISNEAPLRRKDADTGKPGSLTIGSRSSPSPPLSYYVEDGEDVDVSFLKVFLSTKYVDLSSVPQNSPFCELGGHRYVVQVQSKPKVVWNSILVTIIQRRAAK
jgi:hypothetical protein